VVRLREERNYSERHACRLVQQWRSTQRYQARVEQLAGEAGRKILHGILEEEVRQRVVAEWYGTPGGYNGWGKGYVYLAGQLLALYDNTVSPATTFFVHKDHLGSSRLLTKLDKSVQETLDFLPYGEPIGSSGSGTTYRFAGTRRDPESDLDHTLFRKLATLQGRWSSPDPIAGSPLDPQTLNRFAYAKNKPTSVTDSDGLYARDQHEFITFVMAVATGHPDANDIARGAGDADSFRHAATGLGGLGYIINFNKHFGTPCTVGGECPSGGYVLGFKLHLVEDNSVRGPHYLSGGYSFGQRLTSSFKHIALSFLGRNPDTDPNRGGGFAAAWSVLDPQGTAGPYPEEAFEAARKFLNTEGLGIVGASVTMNGRTTTHGQVTNSGVLLAIIIRGKYIIKIYEVEGNKDYRDGRSDLFLHRNEMCGIKQCENP
jgi:RHS repeat-associated protein